MTLKNLSHKKKKGQKKARLTFSVLWMRKKVILSLALKLKVQFCGGNKVVSGGVGYRFWSPQKVSEGYWCGRRLVSYKP